MVTELMPLGSVKDLLAKNKNKWEKEIDPFDIIMMAKDAAAGMVYLASNNIIHRDLAARSNNIFY